jgi:acyl-CoA reductase-like NAD-dependent aldehyde dehydrogenase
MLRWADLVERDRDELALLVALEMGKPIRAAWSIELRALVTTLRFYAELADKTGGELPDVGPDDLALVTREPAGVVAAVTPWNFPLTIAGWKIAPAMAVGCTVVLKPAEESPLSALRVAELALEAGIPEGVLNVVNGPGTVTGRALGLHPDVDVVAFTGSTEVGRHFLRYAADSNLKRVWLELGGKSPNLVFPDAPTWLPLRTPRPGASASTRVRCAPRRRGCSCTRASPRTSPGSSSTASAPGCRGTRWIRRPGSVPSSAGRSWTGSSGTSHARGRRAPAW